MRIADFGLRTLAPRLARPTTRRFWNPRGDVSGRYQASESVDHHADSEGEHAKPKENNGKRDENRRKTKAFVAPGEIERRERDQRRANLIAGDLDATKGQ